MGISHSVVQTSVSPVRCSCTDGCCAMNVRYERFLNGLQRPVLKDMNIHVLVVAIFLLLSSKAGYNDCLPTVSFTNAFQREIPPIFTKCKQTVIHTNLM